MSTRISDLLSALCPGPPTGESGDELLRRALEFPENQRKLKEYIDYRVGGAVAAETFHSTLLRDRAERAEREHNEARAALAEAYGLLNDHAYDTRIHLLLECAPFPSAGNLWRSMERCVEIVRNFIDSHDRRAQDESVGTVPECRCQDCRAAAEALARLEGAGKERRKQ